MKEYKIKLEVSDGPHHETLEFPTLQALNDYFKALEENAENTVATDGGTGEVPVEVPTSAQLRSDVPTPPAEPPAQPKKE